MEVRSCRRCAHFIYHFQYGEKEVKKSLECTSPSMLIDWGMNYWYHGSVENPESLVSLNLKCRIAEVCPDFMPALECAAFEEHVKAIL